MKQKTSLLRCMYIRYLSLQSGLYLHDRLPKHGVVGELVAHSVHGVEHRSVRAFAHVGTDFVERVVGQLLA